MKSPYDIIKSRYVTEKTGILSSLHTSSSNKSLARCENPKYVFLVDVDANKVEIARALEEIYQEQNIRVVAVNTILVKPKRRNRRGKMKPGMKSRYKKAIVTLAVGNNLD